MGEEDRNAGALGGVPASEMIFAPSAATARSERTNVATSGSSLTKIVRRTLHPVVYGQTARARF